MEHSLWSTSISADPLQRAAYFIDFLLSVCAQKPDARFYHCSYTFLLAILHALLPFKEPPLSIAPISSSPDGYLASEYAFLVSRATVIAIGRGDVPALGVLAAIAATERLCGVGCEGHVTVTVLRRDAHSFTFTVS